MMMNKAKHPYISSITLEANTKRYLAVTQLTSQTGEAHDLTQPSSAELVEASHPPKVRRLPQVNESCRPLPLKSSPLASVSNVP